MTPPAKPARDAATKAVQRAAEESSSIWHGKRNRRLARRDAAYAAILAKNEAGNNRNKGSAPVGRISRKGNFGKTNHSGVRTSKPSY